MVLCVLQDLRSSNGTFVNGKKVGSAKLEAGDELVFADQKYTVVEAGVKAAPKVSVEYTPYDISCPPNFDRARKKAGKGLGFLGRIASERKGG
jgi:pSer/pThr/pTyr-binding forkhead associated (FHA) protein